MQTENAVPSLELECKNKKAGPEVIQLLFHTQLS